MKLFGNTYEKRRLSTILSRHRSHRHDHRDVQDWKVIGPRHTRGGCSALRAYRS